VQTAPEPAKEQNQVETTDAKKNFNQTSTKKLNQSLENGYTWRGVH